MRNTVPLSSVVPLSRSPSSASPVLSTGKPWLVQTTQAWAPGRAERKFCDTSSIVAIARPSLSWPVTTRRTRNAMPVSSGRIGAERINPLPHWGRGKGGGGLTENPHPLPRCGRGGLLLRRPDLLLLELRDLP